MGSFTTSGSFGAHWHGDVSFSLNGQNAAANQSSVHVDLVMRADSGYSQAATTSYNVRVNGGVINSGSRSISLNGNSADLISGDVVVNHDANGNWSGSYGGALASGYSGVGSGSGDYGASLPRLALAPSIAAAGANAIRATSVNLYTEINNYGHGTSAGCRFYYKLDTDASWMNTGDQGDAAGNNNFGVTGLKSGRTYQYYVLWFNNNGDTSTSSVQTFKTAAVSGMIPVLIGLM